MVRDESELRQLITTYQDAITHRRPVSDPSRLGRRQLRVEKPAATLKASAFLSLEAFFRRIS